MELRDIEIFLTLAEELHFGRTAERLRVSPARVSQAIKKQERVIGAELFVRTSRNVRLTPIGEQLRTDLIPVYQGLRESMRRARMAAKGVTGTLRVGMLAINGHELKPYWTAFRTRHPHWELQVRHANYVDAFGLLRRGEFDVLVAWTPIREDDLIVGPRVFRERKVLMSSLDHPLADPGPVSLEVLADHSVLSARSTEPEYWEDAFQPFFTPSGRAIPRHQAPIPTLEDIYAIVSAGESVHSLGMHVTRFQTRPDIAYRLIEDGPELHWGLVWHAESENDRIRAMAQVVEDLGEARL
ncbi:LysR family transcriptional regulator [Actinospica robiniae]|uniref:LysR substrate-binding domain-containing protein n=1 Tax=Actinospica robiniae TaxID=304901 RepID=UPI000408064E|nr:LysR family transcriptional regulator [Actinospica robiniae]